MTSAAVPVKTASVPFHESGIDISNYKYVRYLSKGGEGSVVLFEHLDDPTQEKLALKVINFYEMFPRESVREKQLKRVDLQILSLMEFDHPGIIKYISGIRPDPTTFPEGYVLLPLEYFGKQDLFDYIVENFPLSSDKVRKISLQIASAVQYLHSKKKVHRDIKPENIMIDEDLTVKIIDWGMIQNSPNPMTKGGLLHTSCGTPQYSSPEVVRDDEYNNPKAYDGKKSEIWTLGVLFYVLATGGHPFCGYPVDPITEKYDMSNGENLSILITRIQAGKFPLDAVRDPLLKDLISNMIVVDPDKRLTIDEVCSHEFFTAVRAPIAPSPTVVENSSSPSPSTEDQRFQASPTPQNNQDEKSSKEEAIEERASRPRRRRGALSNPTISTAHRTDNVQIIHTKSNDQF